MRNQIQEMSENYVKIMCEKMQEITNQKDNEFS